MAKKVGFVSLGCAKNKVDSEKIMGLLCDGGYEMTADPAEADYIFINTCGFIKSAKEESIDTILEMADYKENGKCEKLLVMGCLAQRYTEQLRKEMPEVDRFITLDEYGDLKRILKEELGMNFSGNDPDRLLSGDPWMAYLKIAEGCFNRCSFCAIPLIRGNYVSEDFDVLVEEAQNLVHNGVKEIVLIAQDTTIYGRDRYKKSRLGELVQAIDKIEGVHWIRILYLYPSEIDVKLLDELKAAKHFIPYFDIPMQYGNDRMLKAMHRKGTIAQFKTIHEEILKRWPDAIFRTTMIVGFPTETEEDFNDLMKFTEEMSFDRLGAFTYSREEDTPAYDMKPQVNGNTKKRRLNQLMTLQSGISQKQGEKMIGRVLDVILEGTNDWGQYYGRSYASAPDQVDGIVEVNSSVIHRFGDVIRVRIDRADAYDLTGEEILDEA